MTGRRIAGLLLVLTVLAPSAEGGRRLAVAIRADAADAQLLQRIEGVLPGWALNPTPVYDGKRVKVFETDDLTAQQVDGLFTEAENVRRVVGVLTAGESYPPGPAKASIYAGWIRVELSQPSDTALVASVAGQWSLTFESPIAGQLDMRLDAPIEPAAVMQVIHDIRPPAGPARPVLYTFGASKPASRRIGGYHRVPPGRNQLAVILRDHVVNPQEHRQFISSGTIDVANDKDEDPDDDVQFVTFFTEAQMATAMRGLLAQHGDIVKRAGPAIDQNPPRVLTARLIVSFVDEWSRVAAQPILEAHDLNVQTARELPYLDHGYIYRREVRGIPDPSYELYDAAADLLDANLAGLAVPDIFTTNEPAADGLACGFRGNQAHLEAIHADEAWAVVGGTVEKTTIGLLDKGFISDEGGGGDGLCKNVNVTALMDATTCDPGGDYYDECLAWDWYCMPSNPRDWCDDHECGGQLRHIGWNDHADALAVIAAGSHDAVRADEPCDTRGVADGAPLVSVGQPDGSTSSMVAAAAWWMAGGDPNDDNYPRESLLTGDRRARVLNFSFARLYDAEDCPVETSEFCAKICLEGGDCSLIDHVLRRLRDGAGDGIHEGGTLVVASVPHFDQESDLHTSAYTTSAGTARYAGAAEPHYANGPLYSALSPAIDLVAPMGGDNSFDAYDHIGSGNTSAAAVVVSGVAAMMFEVAPNLSPAQVDCILKDTAQANPGGYWSHDPLEFTEFNDAGDPNTVDCSFREDGPSECFGFGMVDAGAAVRTAAGCASSDEWVLLYDEEDLEVEEVTTYSVDETGEFVEGTTYVAVPASSEGTFCPCDASGNKIILELADRSGSVSLEPGNPALGDTLEAVKVQHVLALLTCIELGTCYCPERNPSCVELELPNSRTVDYPDIRAELCRDEFCRALRPGDGAWKAGATLRLELPRDEEFVALVRGDVGAGPLELRVTSETNPVRWRRRPPARPDGSPERRQLRQRPE